jgi:hypothetical protein
LSKPESLLLATYALLSLGWLLTTLIAILRPANNLAFQDLAIPSYFAALRELDLEELVEEEQTFAIDFGIQNISATNLEKAEEILL